ncbi:hypothetical protein DPF85_06020 [Limosilactobacillus fermentum]|uniref:DUF6275 family protein n=1 Tax=Limosilactobacillus fermentum TaxID=1613 RepID=UPI000DBF86A8|nr:DUF6275 family protein [Limosilactobacillus fermentum]RAM09896.1 hypothetical protein DPF85_06020 [Limosilactobacillus fermentum]
MSEFNQAKFESEAKKLVAFSYAVDVDEKDVFIVWFSKVGSNAKAMLSSVLDNRYFEVTYFGEEGKYIVDEYDLMRSDVIREEESNDTSTSHLQIGVDKVTASVETKCPICQEHRNIWGLTDAFDLRIKEDILILTVRALYSDKRFWKDAFKIKYCPFCGRKL